MIFKFWIVYNEFKNRFYGFGKEERYVFDVADRHGKSKFFLRRWKAEKDKIVNILKSYYNYIDEENFEDIIQMFVYEHIDGILILKGIPREELDLVNPEFFKNIVYYVSYTVAQRCHIEISENVLADNYISLADELQLKLIGCLVSELSGKLLETIENEIEKYNEEVKNFGKIRKIWKQNKEKYGRKLSVSIPDASNGRNDHEEITREGERDNGEERADRTGFEEEVPRARDERILETSKIQSDDSRDDGRIVAGGNRGENLRLRYPG